MYISISISRLHRPPKIINFFQVFKELQKKAKTWLMFGRWRYAVSYFSSHLHRVLLPSPWCLPHEQLKSQRWFSDGRLSVFLTELRICSLYASSLSLLCDLMRALNESFIEKGDRDCDISWRCLRSSLTVFDSSSHCAQACIFKIRRDYEAKTWLHSHVWFSQKNDAFQKINGWDMP